MAATLGCAAGRLRSRASSTVCRHVRRGGRAATGGVRGVGPRLRSGIAQSAPARPVSCRASDRRGHRSGDAGNRTGAIGTAGGRLRWIEADLASPEWLHALGETRVDAVVSATALHWLEPEALARLYHDLGRLLRPGGLLLNGDHMAFDSALPTFARLSQHAQDEEWTDAAFAARGIETAEQFWDALAAEAAFAPLLAERTARFAAKGRPESPPGFDFHVAALRDAGFREIATIWQVLSDRVLLAVR